jgi:pimeloyl-ACP methyl ester carboxylesterase
MPATIFAPRFARTFSALREHRDILLVDQRGSGKSNRLDCSFAPDSLPAHRHRDAYEGEIRKCRAELEARADLRLYTTPVAMDDLDEVRDWLGYPRVNLFGVSYGTKAAQVYLRQHPDRVRQFVKTMTGLEVDGAVPRVREKLDRQLKARARAGTLRPISAEQFVVNLLSLCVFPFAARPMLAAALQIDDRGFHRFIEQRKTDLPAFFLNALRP